MKLTIRDQTCHLLADRAVYWEEKKMLIIADVHIGKAQFFERQVFPFLKE
jgi:metallophosphoesterase superfamily enzyme